MNLILIDDGASGVHFAPRCDECVAVAQRRGVGCFVLRKNVFPISAVKLHSHARSILHAYANGDNNTTF